MFHDQRTLLNAEESDLALSAQLKSQAQEDTILERIRNLEHMVARQCCWDKDEFYFSEWLLSPIPTGLMIAHDCIFTWEEITSVAKLKGGVIGFHIKSGDAQELFFSELDIDSFAIILDYYHNKDQLQRLPPVKTNPDSVSESQSLSNQTNIITLPSDIIKIIFSLVLNPYVDSITKLSCVCHEWNRLLDDQQFNQIWKKVFISAFPEHQLGTNIPWRKLFHSRIGPENKKSVFNRIEGTMSIYQASNRPNLQVKANIAVWSGKWYYEVRVDKYRQDIALELGWIGLEYYNKNKTTKYTLDLIRKIQFCMDEEKNMEHLIPHNIKNRDIVGCSIDLEGKEVTWYLNGQKIASCTDIQVDLPVYAGMFFDSPMKHLTFSAVHCAAITTLDVTPANFTHAVPEGYKALGGGLVNDSILLLY